MALRIKEEATQGVTVLKLRGRIALGSGSEILRGKLKEMVDAGHKKLILDLRGVTYIDSAGLGALVSSYSTVRQQGIDIKLLSLKREFRDLLQITRPAIVLEAYDSWESALEAFSRPHYFWCNKGRHWVDSLPCEQHG